MRQFSRRAPSQRVIDPLHWTSLCSKPLTAYHPSNLPPPPHDVTSQYPSSPVLSIHLLQVISHSLIPQSSPSTSSRYTCHMSFAYLLTLQMTRWPFITGHIPIFLLTCPPRPTDTHLLNFNPFSVIRILLTLPAPRKLSLLTSATIFPAIAITY
jgi:hypothetical protein